jgi:uncharacterized protein (TIGR02611 family)
MKEQLPVVRPANSTWRLLRRIGIAIAGGVVVFLGVVLLPLPGPGMVVIAVGLGILSLEFETPRRWLVAARAKAAQAAEKIRRRRRKN